MKIINYEEKEMIPLKMTKIILLKSKKNVIYVKKEFYTNKNEENKSKILLAI